MGRKVVLATCSLNQWAMDFDGNLNRILKSKFACMFNICHGGENHVIYMNCMGRNVLNLYMFIKSLKEHM